MISGVQTGPENSIRLDVREKKKKKIFIMEYNDSSPTWKGLKVTVMLQIKGKINNYHYML